MSLTLRPLPTEALAILQTVAAPPRLIAHLTLVHDIACQIEDALDRTWPTLAYDHEAVRIGAALHDIGKIEHPRELTEPGHVHERAGEALLLRKGVSSILARFARTHAQWATEPTPNLEDLLVALADNWWRGRRDTTLEAAFCKQVVAHLGIATWEAFATLDDIATQITADADERLRWQTLHPTQNAAP
jgi:hypothetical protein